MEKRERKIAMVNNPDIRIAEIINQKLRPRTRADGGDILFEKIEDGTIYVGAYADCSVCRCCEPELSWWIQKEVKKELGLEYKVKIIRYKPYYA